MKSHFTDEEVEAPEFKRFAQGNMAKDKVSLDFDPDLPMFLIL